MSIVYILRTYIVKTAGQSAPKKRTINLEQFIYFVQRLFDLTHQMESFTNP